MHLIKLYNFQELYPFATLVIIALDPIFAIKEVLLVVLVYLGNELKREIHYLCAKVAAIFFLK